MGRMRRMGEHDAAPLGLEWCLWTRVLPGCRSPGAGGRRANHGGTEARRRKGNAEILRDYGPGPVGRDGGHKPQAENEAGGRDGDRDEAEE
jgi:hypothetical protein